MGARAWVEELASIKRKEGRVAHSCRVVNPEQDSAVVFIRCLLGTVISQVLGVELEA